MENAAEALKMAGSVLMFIIALSISIMSFSRAREAADTLTYSLDREMAYVDTNNYYLADSNDGCRIVGIETVIPTIKRVFNENYEIQFEFRDGSVDMPLYTIHSKSGGEDQEIRVLKFTDGLNGGNIGKRLFLNAIIYGDTTSLVKGEQFNKYFVDNTNPIVLPAYSLYERLKGKKITETAGTRTESSSAVPDASSREIRVIKYVVENF